MTSTIKVNNVQNQCGQNIINENSNTITIGASGDTIALASGASQTGFGRTGTVDWQTTPKTATFTAVSGEGYFANTSGGAFNMNLPAGSAGAIVSVADYAGTWQTNALTVVPNGTDKIGSVNANVLLDTQGQSVTFVYVDSTQGWINVQDSTSNVRANTYIVATGGTITTSGNDKIHTFTGPGTFTVACTALCSANNQVSYMVVAGGGGAGTQESGNGATGGGGAGGFREDKSPVTPYTASPLEGAGPITVTATSFPIVVGGGGAGGPASIPSKSKGVNGSPSTFSTITSAGGGGGGGSSSSIEPGAAGGSGGGSGQTGSPPYSGGAGNTPPVSPSQGNNGGSATISPAGPNFAGGGGGGATAVGANITTTAGGAGGAGATTGINGSNTAFAGGGGGGTYCAGGTPGTGGSGGGGAGGPPNANASGTAGTANTGGGAGGSSTANNGTPVAGAAGGSGIVIIRYKFQ